jgi:hypothetical protein
MTKKIVTPIMTDEERISYVSMTKEAKKIHDLEFEDRKREEKEEQSKQELKSQVDKLQKRNAELSLALKKWERLPKSIKMLGIIIAKLTTRNDV